MNTKQAKLPAWTLFVLALIGCGSSQGSNASKSLEAPKQASLPGSGAGGGLALPPQGELYHGVFPAGFYSPQPDTDISLDNLSAYEKTVGRPVALVSLDNNWYQGRAFPVETASAIRAQGAVPFIRLMLRSSIDQNGPEPTFSLDRIVAGDFDADLRAWGDAAKSFGTPLVVEWGTEANGDWFSWSGQWNGGGLDGGAAKFKAAFRHIVQTIRGEGAQNISWAFHLNTESFPDDPRNSMSALYPGGDVVDWVGLSVYGATTPTDQSCPSFSSKLDSAIAQLQAAAPGKPVFVFEFGVSGNNPSCDAGKWVKDALDEMLGGGWPSLKGFFWWNERWKNNADPSDDSNMAVQQVPALASAFQQEFSSNQSKSLLDHPLLP